MHGMLARMSLPQPAQSLNILSLNCQFGRQSSLGDFFAALHAEEKYDFLLLQEVTAEVRDIFSYSGAYKMLDIPANSTGDKRGGVTIAHRASYIPEAVEHLSLCELFRSSRSTHYGMAVADFALPQGIVSVASLHLHAGFRSDRRKREMHFVKNFLQERATKLGGSTIVGGDFNNGYPWEQYRTDTLFAPFFTNVTTGIGGTLDSMYAEPAGNIINDISWLLGRVGVHATVKVDHIYVDRSLAVKPVHSRKLPDRVSDHSPIEAMIIT